MFTILTARHAKLFFSILTPTSYFAYGHAVTSKVGVDAQKLNCQVADLCRAWHLKALIAHPASDTLAMWHGCVRTMQGPLLQHALDGTQHKAKREVKDMESAPLGCRGDAGTPS